MITLKSEQKSRTSGVGPNKSSRSLPQARGIVGSVDENVVKSKHALPVMTTILAIHVLTRDFYIISYHTKAKRHGKHLAKETLTMEQGELIIIKLY